MNTYAERTEKTAHEKDKTGIPHKMKANFENSSGFSFNDVRVHYNSEKPAQLRAHAYTQGNEVYVAPGQEKHLPHELGHVVQQKSDTVKPTGEIGGLPLNDDEEMENDADSIADKAQTETPSNAAPVQGKFENGGVVQREEKETGSQYAYNVAAGPISTAFGILGAIGGIGSFLYTKHAERKHRYIEEIEKYADAACEAHEEQKAAFEMYKKSDDNLEMAKARAEVIKQKSKIERNFDTAFKKAIEMENGSHHVRNGVNKVFKSLCRPEKIDEDNYKDKINNKNVVNAITRAKTAKDDSIDETRECMPDIAQPRPLSAPFSGRGRRLGGDGNNNRRP